ncbi:MAG: fumarylacetoacetate hydrolase family protein [Anaerolineae bacterium]|nr:fumarylacetoacetate hydrolase family protein [Anaerolineae bacterium]
MRLATFVWDGREHLGLVLPHPHAGGDWVFVPALVQERLELYASRGTAPYFVSKPRFFAGAAPDDMVELLSLGEAGMSALRRMHDFLLRFLEQSDAYILQVAGAPVSQVRLRAPVPRPRLFFGLVQNSPTVWRHIPERYHLNLFPQGHQRPQGSVLGQGDPVSLPQADLLVGGWNPELGVIIGRGGRDIPVGEAMRHIAGLTVVSDVTFDYFRRLMFDQPEPYDWFEDAMSSWGDKKSDARSPMGPYLVTMDEIGNPYDLLIYTRQNGFLRDRSHTGAMHLGIERTVHWLSSVMTLYPGDVIHMGTMGYDGSPTIDTWAPGEGEVIESEIERVGVLRNPLVVMSAEDEWRSTRSEGRVHPSPVVRDLIDLDRSSLADPSAWQPEHARHFWIVFKNTAAADAEGLQVRPYPRFLNAPARALAASGSEVEIPARAANLSVSCELACVINRLTHGVTAEEAADSIAGYAAMIGLHDSSFADVILEPATPQERNLPQVYARWADGFNVIGALSPLDDPLAHAFSLSVSDVGSAQGSTGDYRLDAAQVIAFISQFITLFPGDVVTLGSPGHQLSLAADGADGTTIRAEIEGLPAVEARLVQRRASDS